MANLYGNYNLQFGDFDLNPKTNQRHYYNKKYCLAESGDSIPQSDESGYVEQLQKDLEELGFQLFPERYNYGTFDETTEWAVREFQIYAKMPIIAKQVKSQGDRYVDCLKQQNNDNQYQGLVSGIVNQETSQLIELWKINKWRCPVVVEAWYEQKDAEKALNLKQALPKKNQNIWLADAVTEDARMFVRDFTGYYDVPSEHSDFSQYYDLSKEAPECIEKLKQLIVIGAYSKVIKGGPASFGAYHVWEPETEIRPENFIDPNKTYQSLNQAERSTYRVVRAVAEIECEGFFDVINAYDDAYISLGPCHWSLGKNELGGFLAYFENKSPEKIKRLIKEFGIFSSKSWNQVQGGNTATGRSIFNLDQRLYNSEVSLQTERGQTKTSKDKRYADYLKTWHWVYHFAMAGREGGNQTTDFRRCMWEFAVMRIRDILSTPIPQEWGIPNVSGRPAQIGDIYTSEKAVALLLRWHVYRPSQVIIREQASQLEEKLLFSVKASDQLEDELNQGKVTVNWQQKFNDANIQGIEIDDLVSKKILNNSTRFWRIKSFYRVRKEDGKFKIYTLSTLLDGCLRDAYQRAGSPIDSSNQANLIQGLIDEMSQVNESLKSTASQVNRWPDWSRGDKAPSKFYRLGEDKEFEIEDPEQTLEKELPQKNGAITKSLSSKWRKQFSDHEISLSQNLEIINRSQQTWSILEKVTGEEKEFVIRKHDQELIVYQIVIKLNKGLSEGDKSFKLSQEAVSTNPSDLPLPAQTKPYGGYKLQFEDFDCKGTERFRYEKRLRTAERGEPVPANENQGYVKQLQENLITLGFLLAPTVTGIFDRFTSYAVREFQIQAQMLKIAQENREAPAGTPYVNKLSAIENTHRYLGNVTGIVNEATGELIKQWLQDNLRCPVVIQAWTMKEGKRDRPVQGRENLWRLQDLTDETVQVFVKDFSGYYKAGIPSSHSVDDWIELGQFFQTGPRSLNQLPENRHCWIESEVSPLNLLGKSPDDLSQAERTLFSIFRAIGEAITGTGSCGFFDSIRTQAQHLPFFWLFGLRTSPTGFLNQPQEDLAAYLAYLRFAEPDSYTTAFGFFGLKPDRNWENEQGVCDGSSMLDINQRRYAAGILLNTEEEEESVPIELEAFEYMGSWHWFYRWVMAARTVPEFQKGLWNYSRLQLQSILSTPWRDTTIKGKQRRAVLQEVYTSEQAIALIYYWYLRFPEDIVDSGKVADSLVAAFQNAGITGNDPSVWTNADEKRLNDALIAKAKELRTEDDFVRGIDYISEWTQKRTDEATLRVYQLYNDNFGRQLALNQTRNSFSFDNSQIPPPSNKIAQKRVIRLSGVPDLSTFGVFALEEQSEDDLEAYQVTAIVLTLASAIETSETGLRIPLNEPIAFNLKLNEDPLPNQELSVLDPSQRTSQAVPVYEIAADADLPSESTRWSLSLTDVQNSGSVLQFAADVVWNLTRSDGSLQRNAYLDIGFDASFIDNPPTWTFAAAASPLNPSTNANQAQIARFKKVDNGLTFTLASLRQALTYALPLRLPSESGEVEVFVQFVENKIRLRLQTKQEISLNLGSSLAQLNFKLAQLTLDSLDGLSLAILPDEENQGISLDLDIFSRAIADQKIINNLWSNVKEFKDDAYEVLESLIRIKSGTISPGLMAKLSQIEQLIVWRNRYPTIHKDIFEVFDKIFINSERQLTSFAGDVLGKISPYQAFFEDVKDVAGTIKLIQEQGRWKLLIPLVILVRENDQTPIIKAKGEFGFWAEADPTNPDTYLDIRSGAFVADEKISLTVLEEKVSSFGDLISLYIPKGSTFIFSTDPRQPSMTWEPSSNKPDTDTRIAIRIPATEKPDLKLKESEDGRFTFEMEKFAIGTAGFDLKGAVRVENVSLGKSNTTGFKEPLAIKGVERRGTKNEQKELEIGEIEFRQSKLVGGSLQAVAQLVYFDDAIATFSLAVSQVDDTLAVAGTVDITGLSEFHVDALFSTFEISLLHLKTTYEKRNGSHSWYSEGAMTGRIKFLPAKGCSASEMGALASLFDGVTVEFDKLNPVKMGAEELKITFPAKRFEFASIFIVDLRGITIKPGEKPEFGLLGDINIQRLPGVDSQFTFGGITLKTNEKGIIPTFDIKRIGAGLSVQGGFKIQGVLEWIENAQEIGFKGKVTIESEALGKLDGLIKVTRLKTTDGYIPSLAIYFQKDIDVSLFAGFFLRNIGIGLGINQALNGLERKKDLPSLPQRIISLVNSPNGLPDPELLESWIPNPPASNQINWMLVAAGLITLGKLPPDVEHPIAGRIILAIDQDLDIVAGVNVWLFTSPNQTQQRQFIERPVARGAIAISPKEQQVFGLFRTVKNPELTDKVPALLAKVLNKIDTSLMFVGDRNGFLLEVGWPWGTKIDYSIGILQGILTSGFRFGVYRGVTSFGLNFAIDIILSFQLGIEFSIGPLKLGAFLRISGKGYFRCSFIGALTPDFTPYLLGNVQLAATVAVKGSACVKFSAKICGVPIRKTLLNISFNINISLSAVLTAALESTNLSFHGSARVVVGIGGYSFKGNVSIEYSPERIKPVAKKLNELLPRRVAPTSFALMQSLESPLLALEKTEPVWNYS